VIGLVSNLLFCYSAPFSEESYLITNGLLLLIFVLLIVYSINKAKQKI
jgi:hypothetical protein